MDIVDDDKDNGRGGGTTRRTRTMAKEDEDGGQGGVLGSVGEGRETQRCWMPLWQEGGSFLRGQQQQGMTTDDDEG